MCDHLIIDHDRVREFPSMSPAVHAVYDKFLTDPFRIISIKELQEELHYAQNYIRSALGELKRILEREGLGTIHNRWGHGYCLRKARA